MNDVEIITELHNGNKEAFRELIAKYQAKIFSIAYKFTNDKMEAQDLCQDIFLKIFTKSNQFKGDSKLYTWIYKICINTCLDWKKKKSNTIKMQSFDNEQVKYNSQQTESLETKVLLKEKQQTLQQIIYNLPDIYKTVIILYHFNNFTYAEIAKILDISEKTVETRLYRARKKIKEILIKKNGGVKNEY